MDSDSYARLLKECIRRKSLIHGRLLHAHIIKNGCNIGIFLTNHILEMYAMCRSVTDARQLFDKIPQRDEFTWNRMIAGYTQCRRLEDARQLFEKMPQRSEVSWNTIIAGYSRYGQLEEAFQIYCQMQRTGIMPNGYTFSSILSACSRLEGGREGKQVHAGVIRRGFESNVFVGSALVDLYGKYQNIEDARQVFDKMSARDEGMWSTMIAGYARYGSSDEALKLYRKMLRSGLKPSQFSLSSILSVCANVPALECGRSLHGYIVRFGFERNLCVGNSMVDMYAKCGSMADAHRVFDEIPKQDIVSWTAIIGGYAHNGCAKESLKLFELLLGTHVKPNHVTFVGVLSACSHAGLVDEAFHYFDSMVQDHYIAPQVDHYGCMIDLLGRAGRLDDAADLINKMPFKPNAVIWGVMLGACRIHGNFELGQIAAEHLLELEPDKSSSYISLSNIYAAAGRWDDAAKMRKLMKSRDIRKAPGYSWIEIKNRVHVFVGENKFYPQTAEIYATLERIADQIKEVKFMPDTNFVLPNLEEERNEQILSYS